MGHSPGEEELCERAPARLGDFLTHCREPLLREWERLVHADPQARGPIPGLLDALAELLRSEDATARSRLGKLAEDHALERLDAGISVRGVLRELKAVREAVLRLYTRYSEGREPGTLLGELQRFSRALDEATETAVAAYGTARERMHSQVVDQLRAREAELDRLLASERAARTEAEESLALLHTFAATTPSGVGYLDRDLRYIMVNEPLAKLHGISSLEHLGKTVRELFPSVADFVEPILQRVLDTGEAMPDVEVEVPCVDEPGKCYRQVSYSPVRTAHGDVIGVGVIAVDITARKRAEQQATRRADFAEELIAIVGHDLRSPINAIALSASALLRKALEDSQRVGLARMRAAAERANRMIGQLMDFTRAQVGSGIPIERRPFDFDGLVMQVLDEVRASFPEREVRAEQGAVGSGTWDPDRLAQVVANLVTNALKHSPAGSPVRVTTRGDSERVVFEVWNPGTIPEAEQARLFQPYHRGQRASREAPSGGIGLGLYITKQLVDAHHGRVEVRSSEAEGTTFTVTLPRG
jgi:PAS domain S-box-containing protein